MDGPRPSRGRHSITKFLDELDAASPPAPSRNADFRPVHDEIPMLQNVARVFLAVVGEAIGDHAMSWSKFVTDSTPHRKIATQKEIEHFLRSKQFSKRDIRR